jgi:hypothetical protein
VKAVATGTLRTLAFGEPGAGMWGCAWADGEACVAVAGTAADDAPLAIADAAITGSRADEPWSVVADGLELTAAAFGRAAVVEALGGFDQLCRVTGTVRLGGADRQVEALGRRAVRAGLDFSRLDSLRDLSAWFAPDEGLALTSMRPRGAKGHDRDTLAATVFGEDGPRPVADPRLSSTYGRDGRLLHTGLELWLDAENDQQYPRRAAADAIGEAVRVERGGITVTAWPLRWHSRGEEGPGVYVLARLSTHA